MTSEKVTASKSGQLRSLLMRAWRERWTASQYASQVKVVLGRGVSGDVYGLADCLLQQALTGPAPNQLVLSLLSHSLATQLVSYSATLHTIAKFSSFSRPHCTSALLNLILDHKKYISCRTNRAEECLLVATSLVAVSSWALSTTSQTIARLVELRDSQVDLTNLALVRDLLVWLTTDTQAACLSYTGRLEDTELHQDLLSTAKLATKACDQVGLFAAENSGTEKELRGLVEAVRSLEPSLDIRRGVAGPRTNIDLVYSLATIVSYDAILCPTSDLTQLAGHLTSVMAIKNISLASLVCQVIRCCLLGMTEQGGFEVLKMDAFTLIKLPRLISLIAGDNGRGEVHQGLQMVLESSALLDTTDARCKGADTYELMVKSMKNLLTDADSAELISARMAQLEKRKMLDLKHLPDCRDVNLIIKADLTLATIIQTFDSRSTEPAEFENLMSVMFHIIKGSSFDLLLSAASANGSLTALTTRLLVFNEGCKESPGESVRVSQNRAALFDMTFLMLVHMVQCFGSEVVLKDAQNCFFTSWARNCMTEPDTVKPLSGWSSAEQNLSADSLLQQISQGEIRTQVVLWHNVCNSVHIVMREMMTAVAADVISKETFASLCRQLKTKLCCLPICVLSWLASFTHYGPAEEKTVSPVEVVDRFLDTQVEAEEGDGLPYFQQRNAMMVNIVKKMREEFKRESRPKNPVTNSSALETDNVMSLEEEMSAVWDSVWRRGRADISNTKELARLYRVGGPEWFVTVLVEKMLSQVYTDEVDRAGEIVFSMMHLDLVTTTLALLLHVLPRCLLGEGGETALVHPGGKCLAKLTVDCLAASLSQRSSRPYGRAGDSRVRGLQLASLCDGPRQPLKLRKLNGGESSLVGSPGEKTSQEQLVDQAHTGLFHLLSGVGMEPVLSPRLEFVCHVMEQSALLTRELSRQVLAPASPALITQLVKVMPGRFRQETILKLFDTNSPAGRKHMARLLCLMRNINSTNTKPEPTSVQ